jgi:hypothetical protein
MASSPMTSNARREQPPAEGTRLPETDRPADIKAYLGKTRGSDKPALVAEALALASD